mmetsp:Transcript_31141/g.58416  ORF Transcript_31141/g.58416 Transcript_31141/m.58416 type:complete len:488 (+) Transcript_31141:89-1552(+)
MDGNAIPLAGHMQNMQVKNTFLDFDAIEDLEFDVSHLARRQLSEPASALGRQLSALQEQATALQQATQAQQAAQQAAQAQAQAAHAQAQAAKAQAQVQALGFRGFVPDGQGTASSSTEVGMAARAPSTQHRVLTGDDLDNNPPNMMSQMWPAQPFFLPGAPPDMAAMVATSPFPGMMMPTGMTPEGMQYSVVHQMPTARDVVDQAQMGSQMAEVFNPNFENQGGYGGPNRPMHQPRGDAAWSGGMSAADPKLAAAAQKAANPMPNKPSGGQIPVDWQSVTTVMLRNLPNKYSQQMLLEELNQSGFAGGYDFMYLPIDPETHANRGYAFINFVTPEFAWLARTTYEGQKMGKFNSEKLVSVVPAALQGFEANYSHYSTARVNRGPPETRPVFLRESCMPRMKPERKRGGRRNQGSLIDMAARQLHKKDPESPQEGIYVGMPTSQKAEHKEPQEQGQFCPNCGAKAQLDHRFCQFCGTPLHHNETVWGA